MEASPPLTISLCLDLVILQRKNYLVSLNGSSASLKLHQFFTIIHYAEIFFQSDKLQKIMEKPLNA